MMYSKHIEYPIITDRASYNDRHYTSSDGGCTTIRALMKQSNYQIPINVTKTFPISGQALAIV